MLLVQLVFCNNKMLSVLRREEICKDIFDIVIDFGNGKRYLKGRFFGKV